MYVYTQRCMCIYTCVYIYIYIYVVIIGLQYVLVCYNNAHSEFSEFR